MLLTAGGDGGHRLVELYSLYRMVVLPAPSRPTCAQHRHGRGSASIRMKGSAEAAAAEPTN